MAIDAVAAHLQVFLVIVTYWPALALFLPKLLGCTRWVSAVCSAQWLDHRYYDALKYPIGRNFHYAVRLAGLSNRLPA
jgi:hypothetical protein